MRGGYNSDGTKDALKPSCVYGRKLGIKAHAHRGARRRRKRKGSVSVVEVYESKAKVNTNNL